MKYTLAYWVWDTQICEVLTLSCRRGLFMPVFRVLAAIAPKDGVPAGESSHDRVHSGHAPMALSAGPEVVVEIIQALADVSVMQLVDRLPGQQLPGVTLRRKGLCQRPAVLETMPR